jgi:hypothetical protein
MQRIYFYKLTVDNGGAPCVRNGLLSLAICKPMIRSTAKPDDLIFGFAAKSLNPDNPLIYVARVTKKLTEGDYYVQSKYGSRRDCIYKQHGRHFKRRAKAKFHYKAADLSHDLGGYPKYERANVLLCTDFRYFGASGTDDYKEQFPRIARAISNLKRGARVHHNELLRAELLKLKDQVWGRSSRKVLGRPTSEPSRSACLRGRSCDIC